MTGVQTCALPIWQSLEDLARRIKVLSRVEFLGRVDQDDLADCYSAADILVLPSSREGWPNVLLESMACGTPVVATAVGGIPEILTSPSVGRLMQKRTAMDLVKAVTDLWGHLPDRSMVQQRAEQCGWQKTTQAQIALFKRVAANSQGHLYA